MSKRPALIAFALLSVGACGTTVPLGVQASAGLSATPGLSDAGVGALPAAGQAAQQAVAPARSGTTSALTTPGVAGGPDVSAPTAIDAPGAGAFGVTATSIYVGITHSTNADAVIAALGINATTGDLKAEAQVVIDEINGRGGIYGRKLVPIYYNIDASADAATVRQAECAAFTQDGHAFAVLEDIKSDGDEGLASCVTKAGGVLVNENLSLVDQEVYRRYPAYVSPGDLRLDRAALARVDGLGKLGYFTPWDTTLQRPGTLPVKIGVLTVDTAPFRRTVNTVLLPALRASGHPVDSNNVVFVDLSSDQSALAGFQGAVLRYMNAGVTHVIIVDAGGGATLFFAQAAEGQQYHPRYGLDSYNAAQLWLNTGTLSASAFTGALGMGWVPLLDLPGDKNPLDGPYSNDTRRRCVRLQRAHGQPLGDVNAERHAVNTCDMLWFLEAALKAGGPNISRASFLAGVTKVGTSFVDGQTFVTRLTDHGHDGVAAARPFRMDASCGCFQYSGALVAVP